MRLESIRSHLRPYSILQKRKTTINHAFASALAPCSEFDLKTLRAALRVLGQADESILRCVYCGGVAETWDHLTGLVKSSELHGFGHQIGNLAPSCGNCNARKGSKDWRRFVAEELEDDPERMNSVLARLNEYQDRYARPLDLESARKAQPEAWAAYDGLRAQIHELMREADVLAEEIRRGISLPVRDRSA